MVKFIETEVIRAGFQKIVIGLSGGIDSALSAYLAVEALGPENVIAVKMPYKTSNPESAKDAEKTAEFLRINLLNIEITNPVDEFFALRGVLNSVRRGNVMARMRMITLFDLAAENSALVLGTGNKTEIMLGYSTLFGDSACSLNAIGDLYKTQVWALSAHFDLPESVVAKAPSADLWAGQTDEDELGITYEIADSILFRLVDKRFSVEETVAEGFDREIVEKVWSRMQKYHFKRVLPPIPKLSPRSVGTDFLYSRDWGT